MSKTNRTITLFLSILAILGTANSFGEEHENSSRRSKSVVKNPSATDLELKTTEIERPKKASRIFIRERHPAEKVKATAHFDTPGNRKSSRRSAAQRLRSAKNAEIFSEAAELSNKPRSPARKIVELKDAVDAIKLEEIDDSAKLSDKQKSSNSPEQISDDLSDATERLQSVPLANGPLQIPGDETVSPSDLVAEAETEESVQDHRIDTATVHPNLETDPTDQTELTLEQGPAAAESTDAIDVNTTNENSESIPSVVTRSAIRHNISQPSTTRDVTPRPRMRLSPIAEVARHEQQADSVLSQDDAVVFDRDNEDDVLFENQNPVLAVRTRGPRKIVVGKAATYAIELLNASDSHAKDVVVNVKIPTWTEVTNQSPSVGAARMQPDDRGNTVLQWSVGKLDGRGKERLTLEIVPKGSRPFDLGVTFSFNPVRSSTQIQVQEPKLDLTVVGPQDIQFGETKVYSITISNPGTGDAENVVLQLLPLVPTEDSAGVRQIGTVKAGTRRTIEVELVARQTGRLQIRAEATADSGLYAKGNQEVIVRRANLDVQVQAPKIKYAGTSAAFTILVKNTGDAIAQDVVAVASLPTGVKKILANGNASIEANHGQVRWELGSLRPDAVRRLDVDCVLTSAGANRIDVRAIASGNLSAVQSGITTVESLADLKLVVNDPKGAIETGANVTYEVRIMNRGTKEAKNISMVGYFSEGIEPSAVQGWTGRIGEGQVDLETIKRLGPGQEMVVRITAAASRPGNHVFRAELVCNNPETRLASEEWTRFYADPPETQQAERSSRKTTTTKR